MVISNQAERSSPRQQLKTTGVCIRVLYLFFYPSVVWKKALNEAYRWRILGLHKPRSKSKRSRSSTSWKPQRAHSIEPE